MIDIKDLNAGDIIVIYHNQEPYHAAIYAPNPNEIGDIIHTCSGFFNSGVRRGTLSSMYKLHQGLNKAGNLWSTSDTPHKVTVHVYRNTDLGEAIANQAVFWMQQGVRYDEKRLLETVNHDASNNNAYTEQDEHATIFEYLKYAARRETNPIKTPYFPNHASSFYSGFGSFVMAPPTNLPTAMVNGGKTLIELGTQQKTRAKGFSCAGFVLACVGAAALKDHIKPVSNETGWVSVKYSRKPAQSAYADAFKKLPKRNTSGLSRPGLHELLTPEQQENFNIDELRTKLAFLVYLNPHRLSIKAMTHELEKLKSLTDLDNHSPWKKIGELKNISLDAHLEGRSKPFNKKDYRTEKLQDVDLIMQNHQRFCKDFGHTAFASDCSPSFSQTVMALFTGEKMSTMDYSAFKFNRSRFGRLNDEEIKQQYLFCIRKDAEIYLKQHWILSLLVLQLGMGSMVKYFADVSYQQINISSAILNYLDNKNNVEAFDINAVEDDTGSDNFYQTFCIKSPLVYS